MPQCPDCGCDLPSFQNLCSKCFDARYAEVGSPKSLLESNREFGSNPRRQQVIKERIETQPWWRQLCWAAIGVGLDWRCAFEWFAGRSAFYSEPVLDRAVLIVLACAGAALLIVCLSRSVRLWFASALFLGLSAVVYDLLSVHWTAHRR
jgi:hypothetical protein